MDINLSLAIETIQEYINSLVRLLPNLFIALLLFGLFVVAAGWVERLVARLLRTTTKSRGAEEVFSRLARYSVIVLGVLVALMVILPGFNPAALVGALGIGSVAIGFAFRDILQNFLAGLIILLTEPFRIGDQIVYGGFEGTVENIQVRATHLKTYDGRRVLIPNAELFTSSVIVNTAFEKRRSEYNVGIGYGDDIDQATELMLDAMRGVDEVCETPEPDVRVMELADSYVVLRARWWTDSTRSDVLRVQSSVLQAIKRELSRNGVDLPFPTQVVLFHDQTEETDGDRRRQREGWPAGSGEVPAPRKIADALKSRERQNGKVREA